MVKLKTYGINGHMFDWIKEFLPTGQYRCELVLNSRQCMPLKMENPRVPCYHQFSFCEW